MDKSSSFSHGYQSGCESTLNQILRLLSQDESIISLNTEDRNTLISRIIDGSDENANNASSSAESRPYLRSQSSHVQRLQETEISMGWNLTDDEEDSPLLTLQNNRNGRLTRYSTFASMKRKSIPPKDHYNMVYFVFCLMGMSTMLPWNFFTAITIFWNYKFRDVSYKNITANSQMDSEQTDLQKQFTSYLSIASNIPNAIFVIMNAIYGAQYSSWKRINVSNGLMIILFIIISGLAATNSDKWQELFLFLMLTIVILVSSSASVFTGSIFGLAGKFPAKYISGAMLGQAVGAVFPAIAVIVILALDIQAKDVGVACFLLATAFLIIGMLAFNWVNRSNFFRYFSHSHVRKTSKTRKISEMEDVEGYIDTVKSKELPSASFFQLFVRAKMYCLAIFFTSFFTLSVYPSLTVLVEHYGTNSKEISNSTTKWETLYFTPITNFLLCSIGDSLGRILANHFQLSKNKERREKVALFLSILRALFIPVFLLCNASPTKRTLPVVFDSDGLFIGFMALLSLGNGYLGNLCMMQGPKIEKENGDIQEKIAMILVAFLVTGQAFGSFMSYFVLQLL